MAVAKKRKLATAGGMSSRFARESVLPLSIDSSFASSSRFFSIRSASFRRRLLRSAAEVFDHAGNAAFAARTASSTSRSSLSGICAITSAVAGLISSKYAPERGGTNAPSMKLASCKELLRFELPLVDVRIPRIPRHDCGHPVAQRWRNHFRNDEGFLAAEFVGVAELEAEDAEDVAGDVPGGLRVPAVGDLHNDAEAFGIFWMLDGEAEEAVRAFLGQDA